MSFSTLNSTTQPSSKLSHENYKGVTLPQNVPRNTSPLWLILSTISLCGSSKYIKLQHKINPFIRQTALFRSYAIASISAIVMIEETIRKTRYWSWHLIYKTAAMPDALRSNNDENNEEDDDDEVD